VISQIRHERKFKILIKKASRLSFKFSKPSDHCIIVAEHKLLRCSNLYLDAAIRNGRGGDFDKKKWSRLNKMYFRIASQFSSHCIMNLFVSLPF